MDLLLGVEKDWPPNTDTLRGRLQGEKDERVAREKETNPISKAGGKLKIRWSENIERVSVLSEMFQVAVREDQTSFHNIY